MGENVFDFDTEFVSDSDVEETLEALTDAVAEAVSDDDKRTSIINPYKMQQIANTYKLLKYALRGVDARVTYTLHEPYQSLGYITVVGKNIVFNNTFWFLKAIEMATNFEVYAKTNGEVEMNFTFLGLTNPIE